jgi:hypothetical protein
VEREDLDDFRVCVIADEKQQNIMHGHVPVGAKRLHHIYNLTRVDGSPNHYTIRDHPAVHYGRVKLWAGNVLGSETDRNFVVCEQPRACYFSIWAFARPAVARRLFAPHAAVLYEFEACMEALERAHRDADRDVLAVFFAQMERFHTTFFGTSPRMLSRCDIMELLMRLDRAFVLPYNAIFAGFAVQQDATICSATCVPTAARARRMTREDAERFKLWEGERVTTFPASDDPTNAAGGDDDDEDDGPAAGARAGAGLDDDGDEDDEPQPPPPPKAPAPQQPAPPPPAPRPRTRKPAGEIDKSPIVFQIKFRRALALYNCERRKQRRASGVYWIPDSDEQELASDEPDPVNNSAPSSLGKRSATEYRDDDDDGDEEDAETDEEKALRLDPANFERVLALDIPLSKPVRIAIQCMTCEQKALATDSVQWCELAEEIRQTIYRAKRAVERASQPVAPPVAAAEDIRKKPFVISLKTDAGDDELVYASSDYRKCVLRYPRMEHISKVWWVRKWIEHYLEADVYVARADAYATIGTLLSGVITYAQQYREIFELTMANVQAQLPHCVDAGTVVAFEIGTSPPRQIEPVEFWKRAHAGRAALEGVAYCCRAAVDAERGCAAFITELLSRAEPYTPDAVPPGLTLVSAVPLTPLQQRAVETAIASPVAIICGDAGTGKSEIARTIAPFLLACMANTPAVPGDEAGDRGLIAFLSFKNDVVQSMRETMLSPPALLPEKQCTFSTIHSFRVAKKSAKSPCPAIIIVDEFGMSPLVHLSMIITQCAKVPGKLRRLVLLGDRRQLAPIGTGVPLAHLSTNLPDLTVHLDRNFRCRDGDLLSAIDAARDGSRAFMDLVYARAPAEHAQGAASFGATLIPCPNLWDRRTPVYLRALHKALVNALRGLDPGSTRYDEVMAISPYHDARIFINLVMNAMYFESGMSVDDMITIATNRTSGAYQPLLRSGARVIFNTNNRKEANNFYRRGQIARFHGLFDHPPKVDITNRNNWHKGFFELRTDKPWRKDMVRTLVIRHARWDHVYYYVKCPPADSMHLVFATLDLCHCLTVTRAQMRGFPRVVVVLPPGHGLDTRDVLYTAVSRASLMCHVISTASHLEHMLTSTVADHNALLPAHIRAIAADEALMATPRHARDVYHEKFAADSINPADLAD